MLSSAQLVAFAPSSDLDRSHAFYAGVLGLERFHDGAPSYRYACNGSQLWVTLVGEVTPQPFTIVGWNVDDLDATHAALVAAGVEPLVYEGFGQDERGIWTAPSGARIIWFADPDGNNLSVQQLPDGFAEGA